MSTFPRLVGQSDANAVAAALGNIYAINVAHTNSAAAVATPVLGAIYPQHHVAAAAAAASLQANSALAAVPVAGTVHVPLPVQVPLGVVGTLGAPAVTAALVLQAQAAQQVCLFRSIN